MRKIFMINVCSELALWGDRSDSLYRSLSPAVADESWVQLEKPVVEFVHYAVENSITEKLEHDRVNPNTEVTSGA